MDKIETKEEASGLSLDEIFTELEKEECSVTYTQVESAMKALELEYDHAEAVSEEVSENDSPDAYEKIKTFMAIKSKLKRLDALFDSKKGQLIKNDFGTMGFKSTPGGPLDLKVTVTTPNWGGQVSVRYAWMWCKVKLSS